jgi:predicted nucleic acid-binding protein
MSKVLIDTDIAINYLRGEKNSKKVIETLWFNNNAYLSLLSIYELHAGMKQHEVEYTEYFIHACQLLPLTPAIVSKAGDYYRYQREKGFTLTAIDCMIYMSAKENNLKLLTRNIKHYPDKEILLEEVQDCNRG